MRPLSHFFLSKSRRLFLFLLRGWSGAALPPMAIEVALLFKVLLFFVGLKSCYVEV